MGNFEAFPWVGVVLCFASWKERVGKEMKLMS